MTKSEAGKLGADKARVILKQKALDRFNSEIKNCEYCNTPITIKEGQRPCNIRKKRFCARRCAALWRNGIPFGSVTEIIYCKTCNNPTKGGKSFCSLKCHAILTRSLYINRWLAGEELGSKCETLVSNYVRNYLLDLSQGKCSLCGWDKINPVTGKCPLEIDHKDGNSSNNRPENLQVICPNCHSLTPSFRNLNKGNGREYRRKKSLEVSVEEY